VVSYSFPDSSSIWSTDPFAGYGPPSGIGEPWTPGYQGVTPSEQAAVTSALQQWADVANIQFQLVADNDSVAGDIRAAWTDGGGMDQYTYAYSYVMLGAAAANGDVWLNDLAGSPMIGQSFAEGAEGYLTLIHELGHAIGLDHPFRPNNPLMPKKGVPYSQNDFKYTVMSYNNAPGNWDDGADSIYPTTPMLLDIQALQKLYGANTSYHSGDDTYVFNGTGNYYETLWDAGGVNTFEYDSATGGLIDLNQGHFSQLGNPIQIRLNSGATVIQKDTVAIAYGTNIQNALGGTGDDTIIGNKLNNMLDGGPGNDVMAGGAGNDIFYVDSSGDVVTESSKAGTDTVIAEDVTFTLPANVENLELRGVLAVNGTGNTLANNLKGNAAANVLNGGAGADAMQGGGGDDTYYVDNTGDRITELLNEGTDTVISTVGYMLGANVENLFLTGTKAINGTGNTLDNQIAGNSAVNTLTGGAGNDTLSGGLGNDILVGGDGQDIFVFDTAPGSKNRDVIKDFVAADDTIYIENAIFTGLTQTGPLDSAAFRVGTGAMDADDRIIYNPQAKALLYDADGIGSVAAVQFATITGITGTLSADDFWIT
jgi:serralysin